MAQKRLFSVYLISPPPFPARFRGLIDRQRLRVADGFDSYPAADVMAKQKCFFETSVFLFFFLAVSRQVRHHRCTVFSPAWRNEDAGSRISAFPSVCVLKVLSP